MSSKCSFRKIKIFKFASSALPLFYSLFRLNHLCIELYIKKALKNRKRLVASRYSLRERSFRKIQIFKFSSSALPIRCCIPCLG